MFKQNEKCIAQIAEYIPRACRGMQLQEAKRLEKKIALYIDDGCDAAVLNAAFAPALNSHTRESFFRASQHLRMKGSDDRANHSRHVLWLPHVLVRQTGPAYSVCRHSLRAAPLCDGRSLVISPDMIADFRAQPFADASFPIGVCDPPHQERVGENAWMGKKYGRLNKKTWRDDLRAGFKKAFLVLRPYGVLIFK